MLYNSTAILCLLVIGCYGNILKCYQGSINASNRTLNELVEQTCDSQQNVCEIKVLSNESDNYSYGCGSVSAVPLSTDMNSEEGSCSLYVNGTVFHCWCRTSFCNKIGSQIHRKLVKEVKNGLLDDLMNQTPDTLFTEVISEENRYANGTAVRAKRSYSSSYRNRSSSEGGGGALLGSIIIIVVIVIIIVAVSGRRRHHHDMYQHNMNGQYMHGQNIYAPNMPAQNINRPITPGPNGETSVEM